MDSSFVNYDGRSVHDMIEALLAMSGDPEAIRRLQESINAVDQRAQSSIAVVNAAIDQLETGKQDAGDYVENGGAPGYPTFKFGAGAYVMNMRRNQNQYSNGVAIMGVNSEADQDGVLREWFRWERNSNTLQGYIHNGQDWSEVSRWTADEDTGWITLQSGIQYRKKNGIVYVHVEFAQADIPSGAGTGWIGLNIGNQLPAGFRPSIVIRNAMGFRLIADNQHKFTMGQINTAGGIQYNAFNIGPVDSTTYNTIVGEFSYPV